MQAVVLHVLNTVIDGNHVLYEERKEYHAISKQGEIKKINEFEYQELREKGLKAFFGTVERGGGRHQFYGTDLTDSVKNAITGQGISTLPLSVEI